MLPVVGFPLPLCSALAQDFKVFFFTDFMNFMDFMGMMFFFTALPS